MAGRQDRVCGTDRSFLGPEDQDLGSVELLQEESSWDPRGLIPAFSMTAGVGW